jgi:hypothetical protein
MPSPLIPSWSEINRSLSGAWRLLLLDPAGMGRFDISIGGFWRSFFAAVLVAPLYALRAMVDPAPAEAEAAGVGHALATVVTYVLAWAAFPVAMIYIARFLDLRGTYVGFIVALNWARVLQAVLLVGVSSAAALAGAPSDFLTLTAIAAVLAYQWVVTKTALATTGTIAAALVIIDALMESLIVAAAAALG